MRIGMILDKRFPPDPRVENEAISLIDHGHEVFLFSLKYLKKEHNDVVKGIQVKKYLSNKLTYKLSALAYTFPFYNYIMSKKIAHFLRTNKIEVIHIHDLQIAESVFRANRELKLKIILDLHENRPEIMKFYPHLQKFPGKLLISVKKWKAKEEEYIQKSDAIIVVTNEAKMELIERVGIGFNKIVVVPNTVYKSYFANARFENKIIEKFKNDFVLLYVGDTGFRRGLKTVIDSVLILKDTIASLKLVVVGCNSYDKVLKNQVKELGIQKHVEFEGWQNEQLFPSFITASSICISPLHRNLHHDTTYANKLFQYMSFGKPVLVSNAIAQKNLIERTKSGLVHEDRDSVDFANKILQLFKDKMFRDTLGKNGKRFVDEEFYWEKTSKDLINLYDNLN